MQYEGETAVTVKYLLIYSSVLFFSFLKFIIIVLCSVDWKIDKEKEEEEEKERK